MSPALGIGLAMAAGIVLAAMLLDRLRERRTVPRRAIERWEGEGDTVAPPAPAAAPDDAR